MTGTIPIAVVRTARERSIQHLRELEDRINALRSELETAQASHVATRGAILMSEQLIKEYEERNKAAQAAAEPLPENVATLPAVAADAKE